jgi:predicted MFS family arabinose efflux permease
MVRNAIPQPAGTNGASRRVTRALLVGSLLLAPLRAVVGDGSANGTAPGASRPAEPQVPVSRVSWAVIAAYASVCAATQVLWLTFAPITTESSRYYGVSVSSIGWLAEIFPLLYVVLAVPAGWLLDKWFRPSLGFGASLVAAGGMLRLGGATFAWALAGQVLVAVAQPLVLSAVSKLSGEYLPQRHRATGIAIGSAGSFAGMVVALTLGPTVGAHGHLERLLIVEAVIGLVPSLALVALLFTPPGHSEEHAAIEGNAVRALWRMPLMRTLLALVFVGFGLFVAIATWLQQLLEPSGVSEQEAGALLVAMVLAGVVACAVIPPIVDRRGSQRRFMELAVGVACVGCVLLGVLNSTWARGVVIVVMGIVLLPALPVILTDAERLAGPAAGTAGAIIWMAGNLGGLVVALIVQSLVHHPLPAFIAMAAVALLGFPFAMRAHPPDEVLT